MMQSERITFPGAHGFELAARFDRPEGDINAVVLFAHCFTCGKDLSAINRIAQALTAEGLAILRFDFTGLGKSQGEFSNTNFSSNIQDLLAAADFLRQRNQAPAILLGHSLGGTAVLAAADAIPEVKAVATIAAPFDASHILHHFATTIEQIETDGEAEVLLAGRPFRIQKQFIDDVRTHTMEDKVAHLNRPLMIFHSPTDETVGIENARQIFETAKHPKSFISLDGADHLLMERDKDGIFVAQMLAAWAARYLG